MVTTIFHTFSARGFVEQAFRLCGTDALGVCLWTFYISSRLVAHALLRAAFTLV